MSISRQKRFSCLSQLIKCLRGGDRWAAMMSYNIFIYYTFSSASTSASSGLDLMSFLMWSINGLSDSSVSEYDNELTKWPALSRSLRKASMRFADFSNSSDKEGMELFSFSNRRAFSTESTPSITSGLSRSSPVPRNNNMASWEERLDENG